MSRTAKLRATLHDILMAPPPAATATAAAADSDDVDAAAGYGLPVATLLDLVAQYLATPPEVTTIIGAKTPLGLSPLLPSKVNSPASCVIWWRSPAKVVLQTNVAEAKNSTAATTATHTSGSSSGGGDRVPYLMIAETETHVIRAMNMRTKQFGLFAGRFGQSGYANGKLLDSQFTRPISLAVLALDNALAIVESGRIRRILGDDSSLLAGNGSRGCTDGCGIDASFNHPTQLACSRDGTFGIITDTDNHRLRHIDLTTNTVTTIKPIVVATAPPHAVAAGLTAAPPPAATNHAVAAIADVKSGSIEPAPASTAAATRPAATFRLETPISVCFDADSTHAYVIDSEYPLTLLKYRVATNQLSAIPLAAPVYPACAVAVTPHHLVVSSQNHLYYVDTRNGHSEQFTGQDTSTKGAGGGAGGGTAGASLGAIHNQSGTLPLPNAIFNNPKGLCLSHTFDSLDPTTGRSTAGEDACLYVCDFARSAIRRVTLPPLWNIIPTLSFV